MHRTFAWHAAIALALALCALGDARTRAAESGPSIWPQDEPGAVVLPVPPRANVAATGKATVAARDAETVTLRAVASESPLVGALERRLTGGPRRAEHPSQPEKSETGPLHAHAAADPTVGFAVLGAGTEDPSPHAPQRAVGLSARNKEVVAGEDCGAAAEVPLTQPELDTAENLHPIREAITPVFGASLHAAHSTSDLETAPSLLPPELVAGTMWNHLSAADAAARGAVEGSIGAPRASGAMPDVVRSLELPDVAADGGPLVRRPEWTGETDCCVRPPEFALEAAAAGNPPAIVPLSVPTGQAAAAPHNNVPALLQLEAPAARICLEIGNAATPDANASDRFADGHPHPTVPPAPRIDLRVHPAAAELPAPPDPQPMPSMAR